MLADYIGFFSRNNLGNFGFRWLHILVGITWIGLLYYFNFVQVPAFAAYGDEGKARNIAIDKVARRALWWFRWAAISTFVTGILITVVTENYFSDGFGKSGKGLAISVGMLIGTIMMLNVWGVIWRNQKVVLANAVNVLAGGEADPAAAAAGRKALMASRQNTVFSVSMLFFMVYASHGPYSFATDLGGGKVGHVLVDLAHPHRGARAERAGHDAVEDATEQGPEHVVRRWRAQHADRRLRPVGDLPRPHRDLPEALIEPPGSPVAPM